MAPGFFRSEITADLYDSEKGSAWLRRGTLLPDEGRAEDVVGAVLWLVSDAGRYTTGQTIVVDGGWTARLTHRRRRAGAPVSASAAAATCGPLPSPRNLVSGHSISGGATMALCERYAVADVDSHIIEPADLWTSRVSTRSGATSSPTCASTSAGRRTTGTSATTSSTASAPSPRPSGPSSRRRTRSGCREAFLPAVDAKARLAYNDEVGVHYQVLYPNILGFHSHVFLKNMPPELATECVRAYNDWLVEWCSADSSRLDPDDDAAVLGRRRGRSPR